MGMTQPMTGWVTLGVGVRITIFIIYQPHLIKHPCLFNHPAKYHIIQIIRGYVLGIQAHAFIFSRRRFSADVNTGYSLVECLREIDEREAKH